MKSYSENLDFINQLTLDEITITHAKESHSNTKSNRHLLSNRGRYLIDASDIHCKLNVLTDSLDMIEVFLTSYEALKFKENNINEIDYINYHLEIYYHKIHTILELMKLATNEIFQLGIPYEDCNWKNIQKQKRDIIDSNVLDIIDRYYKSFKSSISVRHHNTHRASNVNPSSHRLSIKLSLLENSNSSNFISVVEVGKDIQKHRDEKSNMIKKGKAIAKRYVDEFNFEIIREMVRRVETLE